MIRQTQNDKNPKSKKIIKWILIGSGLIIFFIIYKVFNPYKYNFFPDCIFNELTGYKCPGCGSQRAIHYLFNLDFLNAFKENMLLVISIPYLILGAYFDLIIIKTKQQMSIRNFFFGYKAILIVFFIIIGFWIIRNISF
jgi:hypothetical protein